MLNEFTSLDYHFNNYYYYDSDGRDANLRKILRKNHYIIFVDVERLLSIFNYNITY